MVGENGEIVFDEYLMDHMEADAAYGAPETFKLGITKSGDVFSLGTVFYEVCTQSQIFQGEEAWVILGLVMDGKMPPIGKIAEPMRSIIRECWALNPQNRPTAQKVCDSISGMNLTVLSIP
jgi:serine/threonine protein kinase